MPKTYEHFFNLSEDMLCIAGLDGYFKLLNPAFEKTLGYTKEELCSKPYQEFIHPEDRGKKCERQKKQRGDSSVVCCEERYLCKDGSYKWLSWTDYTNVDEGLIYAVARDITERKQAEAALQKARDELELRIRERTAELLKTNEELKAEIQERERIGKALEESEERYRILFEESPIALWEKDFSEIKRQIDGLRESGVNDFRAYFRDHPETVTRYATMMRIVDANNTMVDLYQAESKEEFLTDIVKVFFDETYDLFRGELLAIAEGNLIHEGEGVTRKFTGEKNNIVIKWAVPPGYRETFSKVLVSVIDITERKRSEEALRESEMKLIHANKMTALGTLVSGIAHEINNPNSFILTNADLLSDIWKEEAGEIIAAHYLKNTKNLPVRPSLDLREVIPKLLSGINDGALRIKAIIDNLRDLSRPDRSNMDERVDINKVIMVSGAILANQIKISTHNFRTMCDKDIPFVKGSSQQIEQVVMNLIMNALQALHHKDCAVSVSTSYNKKADCVVINVRDEGTGMNKDTLARITEPFFTTKQDSGGTGLGLSISYAIIKEHNGTLEFESEPGKGTAATIKLPALNT